MSSASAFLSLASAAASTAVSIFSTEAVRHEFAAAALQELQMSVGSFGIGGPSLVLVRQSPGPMLVHLPDTTKSKAARGYALIDTAHLGEVAWSSDLVCRDRALAADTPHRFE